MENHLITLSWGVRKRLHFLEFKLFWEGQVNRGDLTAAFGTSIPQASADIARYQELAKQNITYNQSAKYYIPTKEFTPILIRPTAESYFSEVTYQPYFSEKYSSLDGYIGLVPNPTRIINIQTLKSVIHAIKNNRKIIIDYRSFKNPQSGDEREISPHSFGFDGFRWHTRAYCHKDNKFKDFVLGRIVSISDSVESDVDISSDQQWNNIINVIIGPNQKQNEDQKKFIAIDYGMTDQVLIIKCRIALLWYLLKKLGVGVNDNERPGHEQQIVLINKEEIFHAMNS